MFLCAALLLPMCFLPTAQSKRVQIAEGALVAIDDGTQTQPAGAILDATIRDASKILNGKDVDVVDISSKGIAHFSRKTPFPAFVSLVWDCDVGNKAEIERCGGILYRRKYVITAAHCLKTFDTCPIKAYLNPYRNPFVKAMIKVQKATAFLRSDDEKKFLQDFQEDADNYGLGVELSAVKGVFQHRGWLSKQSTLGDQAPHDIAVVALEEAPFADDSPAWELLDLSKILKVDSSPSAVSTGTIYGFGDTGNACLEYESVNCVLQEKALPMLSYKDCMGIEVELAYLTMVKLASGLKAQMQSPAFAQAPKEQVAALQEALAMIDKLGETLNARSKIWEDYWTSKNTSAKQQKTSKDLEDLQAPVQSSADALTKEAADAVIKIQELLPSPTLQAFALHEVREGKQICIHSPTGVQMEGDSGGPLVDADNQLIGVASWAHGAHGPTQMSTPRWTSQGGPFDSMLMPGFYIAVGEYKSQIDDLLGCLEGPSDGKDCMFG